MRNIHSHLSLIFCLVCLIILGSNPILIGQTKPIDKTNISIHSENNQIIDATTQPPTNYLNGDVKVFHSNTFMYCDTAVLRGSDLRMYFNVVLLQNDTIKIFADSLHYNGDSLVAYFYGDIILENGPSKKLYTSYLKYDVQNKTGYYTQNAKLIDGKSSLISKRGRYLLNEKTAYFYHNVEVLSDDFRMVSDSLSYNMDLQKTNFLAPVHIYKDTSQIYSQRGWFDLDDKIGDFIGDAQYLAGKTIATADTISYNGAKDVVLLKSGEKISKYISEKDTAYAKQIYYDKNNEIFQLTKDAWYKGEQNEVTGDKIFYNKKTEKFNVAGRSKISDEPNIIEADTLDYDKATKYGIADGHVIWRDTSAKTSIQADHLVYKGEDNFMRATNDIGKPLFTTDIDGDTLYMRADTLKSFRVIKERILYPDKNALRKAKLQKIKTDKANEIIGVKTDSVSVGIDNITTAQDSTLTPIITDTVYTGIMDTFDYFVGDNHVKMFKSDMQSVCDSLVFSKSDSVFTLHQNPFVWSDSSQIAGDTIDIFLKNKKADKLVVRSGATILSTQDYQFFNQIKGQYLEALFRENKIYRMNVNGSAQVVYYLTDKDKAYIGVNTTESSNMSFYMENNKITDIRNYGNPKSKVQPMNQADHEALKVKGFIWNVMSRPLGLLDL